MARKILNRVTVTGADDGCSIKDMIAIYEEFPFVEFAILLSKKQNPSQSMRQVGRWPSHEWLRRLAEMELCGLPLAGHLCGSWVRELLVGRWPYKEIAETIHPDLMQKFKRLQINTHAEPHVFDGIHLAACVNELAPYSEIIFQNDGVNHELLSTVVNAGCKNVSTLFDLSHGAGILPKEWPMQLPDVYCGYAGGLHPKNVASQLTRVEALVGDSPIWIDAETHLRTQYWNNDAGDQSYTVDYFDLDKVRDFLIAAKPWVIDP